MPHGWKYLMDTTTENRIYNVARKNYVDYQLYSRHRPNVERGLRTIFVHNKARKKRKWLKPRTLEKLLAAIPDDTHVLVKNPHPTMSWNFPVGKGDYSEDNIIGVIKGFYPPGEVSEPYVRGEPPKPPRIPGKYYTRKRRYRVVPIVGSSKGRNLRYDEDQLTIVDPADIPQLLFVMQIRAMKGEI